MMEFAVLRIFRFAVVLIISISFVQAFNLTILHTNDVHSHFVEFNTFGGRCSDKIREQKKCFGGFARQVTKSKEIRSNRENVLYLNGGDFYQGTVWYTLHRWQIVAELVNQLNIDIMSLGNHEFDDGLKGLYPFLENLKTKVVVCNIDASKIPKFAEYVSPSTIIEVGGERIGVIGYLTPETKFLSSADRVYVPSLPNDLPELRHRNEERIASMTPDLLTEEWEELDFRCRITKGAPIEHIYEKLGDLEFEDEVECIKREAKRLATEENLNKIFAVGHSGFAVDQNIAKEVPEIDVVVGGHTNTFLYSGDLPSVEQPQGSYPVVITRDDGSQALVVQDFAFGKYLGFLEVVFDDDGKVISWGGNPILLDASVEEDEETLELLKPYADEVKRRVRQVVGKTNVLLRGDRLTCRMKECNLGNFLADASLDFFIEQPTEKGWNFVAIALWNSGGIRASIDERINGGNITLEDVLAVAPFGNTMDVVALKGKHLKDVLEQSVRDYDLLAIDPPGSLLQVSGLRVTYNMSQPAGSRLVEVYARCADCRVPKYLPVEDEKVYEVVMNTYMAKGGDNFGDIKKNAISNRNTDELDVDIITKYAAKTQPAITGIEGRITILTSNEEKNYTQGVNDTDIPIDSTSEAVEPMVETDAPELASEGPNSNVLTDITSGFNKLGSEMRNAGDELSKIPKNLPIIGRRRR